MTDFVEVEEGISVAEIREYLKVHRCDIRNFSKVYIKDGMILYRLYAQDGGMIEMNCRDTYENRLFVSWVQVHDRYGPLDRYWGA